MLLASSNMVHLNVLLKCNTVYFKRKCNKWLIVLIIYEFIQYLQLTC